MQKPFQERLLELVRNHRHVLRAWVVFVVTVGLLIQVLIWARPFTDTKVTRWVAVMAAWLLDLFGLEGRTQGTIIVSSLGSVEIIRECTAVYPTAFFIAAVVAFPCSWMRKLVGIAMGIVAIQGVNMVRIISLCYIHKWYPQVFTTAHLVVWQSLVVFFTLVFWILWSTELTGRRRHAA